MNLSTALNRTTSYHVEDLPIGDLRRTVTEPTGLATVSVQKTNGTTTLTAPDGTITTQVEGPDPRFSMQSPILKSLTVATPLGLTSNVTTTRAVTLSNQSDPLSLATQTDTLATSNKGSGLVSCYISSRHDKLAVWLGHFDYNLTGRFTMSRLGAMDGKTFSRTTGIASRFWSAWERLCSAFTGSATPTA